MFKRSILTFITLTLLFGIQLKSFSLSDDFERGKRAFKSSDYGLAMQYFRRSLSSNPGNPTVRYYLAQSLVKSRQLEPAQKEFQRIIQVSPYSQEAKYAKIALVQIRDHINNSLYPKWRPLNSSLQVGVTETTSVADVGDNYIDKVTEKGNVIRWQSTKMPLKVYIDTSPRKVEAFDPSFIPAVRTGIEKWVAPSKGNLSLTYVKSPEQADVKIYWKTILDVKLTGSEAGTPYTAGVTTPDYSDKELYAMQITLTTTDPNGKTHKAEDVEKVATHEFGHALGIMGHSEKPGDIMFPSSQTDGELTKRDINTLILLYDLAPDISNFRGVSGTEIADKGTTSKSEILGSKEERIQREIEELEAAVKENPKSDINHVNLGNLYGNKGDYEAAIKEYKKAIHLNPDNDVAYSNLGSMYQNQGMLYDALRAYNESKKLNDKKPKPYLQVAIISEQLNQKAEAIMALEDYLSLNPRAKTDQEVINLANKLNYSL
jgi:tetratricopeptide (TPR) repeat protein